MPIVRFERRELIATLWKNRGGETREIVRVPAGSTMDNFDWRASTADVSADGPFSPFVGVDRVLVLLDGDGVHLTSSDGRIDHRLDAPLMPFSFAGESQIEASLIGAASSDFNVMTRRSTTSADVKIFRASGRLPVCSAGVLLAARGRWDIQSLGSESSSFSLDGDAGVWWDGESLQWELAPHAEGSALIAVRIQ